MDEPDVIIDKPCGQVMKRMRNILVGNKNTQLLGFVLIFFFTDIRTPYHQDVCRREELW
jgi:hypothetical protein